MAVVIVMANQKGGVAKTTTTKALGLGLSRVGKKVLMIDLDASGNLSMGMGVGDINQYVGIAGLLSSRIYRKKTVQRKYVLSIGQVDLLVGNQDLEPINISLPSYPDGLFYLDEIVGQFRVYYDYILIDTMPVLGPLVRAAMIASDQVLIPINPEYYSLEGMQRLLDEIAMIQKRYNPRLTIAGLLPTRVDLRLKREHQDYLRELYQTYAGELNIFSYIPVSTTLSLSSRGEDMYQNKREESVVAYQELTERILRTTSVPVDQK